MEYKRFLSMTVLITVAALTIYVGCRRSYAIYFFERDAKRVIFLEQWTAAAVPIVLSFLLIVSYLSAKRMKMIEEEILAKKFSRSPHSSPGSRSRKISRSSDLESIPEMSSESRKNSTMHSISESSESGEGGKDRVRKHGSTNSPHRQGAFNEATLEELAKETERLNEVENVAHSHHSSVNESAEKVELEDDVPIKRDIQRAPSIPISRKSSDISNYEIKVQRKQSMIYEQIGKIDFIPLSLKRTLEVLKKPSLRSLRKDSLFDIGLQLVGVHLPMWLCVLALHITLVEIFNMKFYYQYYYHHPGMTLLALFISVSVGLFHEMRWTWIVNDILAIASAYIVIARVQIRIFCTYYGSTCCILLKFLSRSEAVKMFTVESIKNNHVQSLTSLK